MEKWGKERPPRRGHEYPSFSSTLLDAIYRSIDESDAGAAALEPPSMASAAPRRPSPVYHPAAASKERTVTRPARRLPPISTSSSSDNSSYGGFSSSSEPESAASHHRGRIRPIRTLSAAPARSVPRPPPPPRPPQRRAPSPPAAHHHLEKSKSSSIRSKLRDLGRSRAPASPGARFASLLNSIFATAAGRPRKPKAPTPAAVDDSACSTASSYSRSCLVKTPSSRRGLPLEDEGVKRSVRFNPVSVIVGEDLRPCGQKIIYAGNRCEEAAAEDEEDRRRRSAAAEGKGREEARRRAEALLRRYADEAEEEEDEEDEMSDSSSDLFELENLTAVGGGCGGAGGGYRYELPVYETTHPGTNRAISRGLVQ